MSLHLKNISLPLEHFTLEVEVELRGGVTAIFGPSGAGKTSLLDLIAGLRSADSAFIQLGETVLTNTSKSLSVPVHQRRIGYVPQDLALFPHLSVRQNLNYGRQSHRDANPLCSFDHVTKVLEIEPLISRGVTQLSGGEKQRVALARALMASPRLLLLDEPLASLDAALKSKVIVYLNRIRDEFHIPTVIVTHDRFEALTLASEVLVIIQGKVEQAGAVLEVFNRPANAGVAKIVGVETLHPGAVTAVNNGLATVAIGSVVLTAIAPPEPARDVFVCIRGEEVILQRDASAPSSVRNRLAARVVGMRTEGALVRVELDAGFPLFAFVTRPACAELGLREGETIAALIKAPAIHLVPR